MGKDSWLNEKSWKLQKFSDFMVLSYTIVYIRVKQPIFLYV